MADAADDAEDLTLVAGTRIRTRVGVSRRIYRPLVSAFAGSSCVGCPANAPVRALAGLLAACCSRSCCVLSAYWPRSR
jgi:hypothetical protein